MKYKSCDVYNCCLHFNMSSVIYFHVASTKIVWEKHLRHQSCIWTSGTKKSYSSGFVLTLWSQFFGDNNWQLCITSCFLFSAKAGDEVAHCPCPSSHSPLLSDSAAACRSHTEPWVHFQSFHGAPEANGCTASIRGPCTCHQPVQCCPDSHCQQCYAPRNGNIASLWVLATREPWICPLSGLELCPSPGLDTQSHSQLAATTVGQFIHHRSVIDNTTKSKLMLLLLNKIVYTSPLMNPSLCLLHTLLRLMGRALFLSL